MGLDLVELIVTVEEVFQIQIADDEANRLSTVGDLHQLVLGKLGDSNSGLAGMGEVRDSRQQDVRETLCQIIVAQTEVSRETVTPEISILDDLGID
jgi:acyl carrier protein